MFRKSNFFTFFSVVALACGLTYAQDAQSKPREATAPVFEAFSFGGGGSYLGVQTQEVTKENFSKFGLSGVRGVAIEKVMDDSPAKKAGLQDGDVIIRFNGEEVSSYRKLTRLIGETAPDHQAKLTVARGGSEREITVTMGKHEMPKFEMGNLNMITPSINTARAFDGVKQLRELQQGAMGDVFVWGEGKEGNFVWGSTRQIGVGVSSLNKQLGEYFGAADGKGLLINNVAENSAAAKAGLKAGDVIVEVEGKAVGNTMDLIRGINEKKEGEVTLTILRNRNRQTVKVTPEKMKEGEMPFSISRSGGMGTIRAVPGVRVAPLAPGVRMTPPTRVIAPTRVRAIPRIL